MLQLYNTMSRSKEVFRPRREGEVKMFTCGPSIYARPHVGNFRTFLWEDVLLRYLEYRGNRVLRVINFTDVEDKALEEAGKKGATVLELTESMSHHFFDDAKLLRIKLPDFIPRSSTSVDQAVRLIDVMLQKGCAYRHEGDIFFDPLKFKGFGKLFRLDMSRWPRERKRFKRDTYNGRRWNLGDFILWHGCKAGEDLCWDTEIGNGRPSWNIQDPAIITKHLGFTIDISCGGIDNLYRHHDYNIAVIESVSGEEFANYWMHCEHLLVGGKKMSKSIGNIVYPEDLLRAGYDARQLRFYLIYGRYRKRINLTDENLRSAASRLGAFREMVERIIGTVPGDENEASTGGEAAEWVGKLIPSFEKAMDDDLDMETAFDDVCGVVEKLEKLKREGRLNSGDVVCIEGDLRRIDEVWQVVFP
ncbi:MAG: class I tRNA ligase family protein [Desulfobacteraceae bacterium]|nr:class I tRNA ligase family protein [Desulfobacteraceae bacterium]